MANIKDFGEFVTPTGQRGNIFSVRSWFMMVLGVVAFLVAFAMGQNVTQKIGQRLPIDTDIDPLIRQKQTTGKAYL